MKFFKIQILITLATICYSTLAASGFQHSGLKQRNVDNNMKNRRSAYVVENRPVTTYPRHFTRNPSSGRLAVGADRAISQIIAKQVRNNNLRRLLKMQMNHGRLLRSMHGMQGVRKTKTGFSE